MDFGVAEGGLPNCQEFWRARARRRWALDTASYTYDANGNSTIAGYATSPNNQLLSDGTWTYTYDAEGNQTQKLNLGTGEKWTYSWDNLNRMVGIKDES